MHVVLESLPAALQSMLDEKGVNTPPRHPDVEPWAVLANRRRVISSASNDGPTGTEVRPRLLVLSAKSEWSLNEQSKRLKIWCNSRRTSKFLEDLAYTLTCHRSSLTWRRAFVAATESEFLDSLESSKLSAVKASKSQSLCFIFSGQGSQWAGMARELLWLDGFRDSITKSEEVLGQLGATWNLAEELLKDVSISSLGESAVGQPAACAIQIALVDLLRSLNVRPDTVLGHSSGEIAAAYAANALSQEEALQVAFYRGFLSKRCFSKLGRKGAMLAVTETESETSKHINKLSKGNVVVACVNSPSSTVVSGDQRAIGELQNVLEAFEISCKRLKVDAAYHSPHMQSVADKYLDNIKNVGYRQPDSSVQYYSSVTAGRKATGFGPHYWVENLISKVRFYDALQTLRRETYERTFKKSESHIILEVGPNNSLRSPVNQTVSLYKLDGLQETYVSCLQRDKDCLRTFLYALSHLFQQGYPVDLKKANSLSKCVKDSDVLSDLPPYPFDHRVSYWHESLVMKEHRMRAQPYHDLLGLRIPGDTLLEPMWRHVLSVEHLPWLHDHRIEERMVFPAAGYLCMVIQAVEQIFIARPHSPTEVIEDFCLKNVEFKEALSIPDSADDVEIRLTLREATEADSQPAIVWQYFRITSVTSASEVSEHCSGHVRVKTGDDKSAALHKGSHVAPDPSGETSHQSEGVPSVSFAPASIYELMKRKGHEWKNDFAAVTEFAAGDHRASGRVTIPDAAQSMPGKCLQPHVIHPTTLDALIHTSLMLYGRTYDKDIMLPVTIGYMTVSAQISRQAGAQLVFVTAIEEEFESSVGFQLSVTSEDGSRNGSPCLHLCDGSLRGNNISSQPRPSSDTADFFVLDWGVDVGCAADYLKAPQSTIPDVDEKILDALNLLSVQFVQSALRSLSLDTVSPRFRKYVTHMADYATRESPSVFDSGTDVMASDVVGSGADFEAVTRIGNSLERILTGEVDPLNLLLEDDLLTRMYAESPWAKKCFEHLVNFLEKVHFKQPGLRIIEVGAGTGGATLPLLDALCGKDPRSSVESFDFTDVTAGFFDQARERLKQWGDLINYRILNIDQDLVAQGFEEDSYDIVIAYNAMHVSTSIDAAIQNVKRIMKPGGYLVLLEITRLAPYITAIYGLLPGWFTGRRFGLAWETL